MRIIEFIKQTRCRLARHKAQKRIRALRAQLHWQGDLDTLRAGRGERENGE